MHDGSVGVRKSDGTLLTVKNNGVTGYEFADKYLDRMGEHYDGHLRAADMILRRMTGEVYRDIKRDKRLYRSHLAVVSLNCAFGEMDGTPDCDEQGNMHFEFTRCPFRSTCPFNGYSERNHGAAFLCCNPRYETNLTPRQARVADLLVNSGLSACQIADELGMTIKSVQNATAEIFAHMGVNTRQELTLLLHGKRLY